MVGYIVSYLAHVKLAYFVWLDMCNFRGGAGGGWGGSRVRSPLGVDAHTIRSGVAVWLLLYVWWVHRWVWCGAYDRSTSSIVCVQMHRCVGAGAYLLRGCVGADAYLMRGCVGADAYLMRGWWTLGYTLLTLADVWTIGYELLSIDR